MTQCLIKHDIMKTYGQMEGQINKLLTSTLLSTDHELIPARNASLAASANEVMFVTIQRENIRPSKKEVNKPVTMLKLSDVYS
jgi:hypothetical protein